MIYNYRMHNLHINKQTGIAYQIDTSTIVAYDQTYWQKYQSYANSPNAQYINNSRLKLISKYNYENIIDIGIGNGQFCESANCKGFDINHSAVDWLIDQNRLKNPYSQKNKSLSFWDSLEHFKDPTQILNTITKFAFISIPIVKDWETIETWKHWRPDEHLWYFSEQGLCNYMEQKNFRHIETNDAETTAGRQDILSFVFEKKDCHTGKNENI